MSFTPYTHADHAARCRAAAHEGKVLSLQRVQVLLNHVAVCATICGAWDHEDGSEMWKLDLCGPVHGRMSMPARRVRQCSGLDGRCSCAGETPASAERSGAARAAGVSGPEGVTCL